jgi:hypothetical protein
MELDKSLWAPLLEFTAFKPTKKRVAITAITKIIMTGGCVPSDVDCDKRFFQVEDPRKTGLKNGLRQLTIERLQRVIDYPGEMVLDTFNYQDGKFCPLAVALELDKMPEPSHEKVFQALTDLGYSVYNTRGIAGDFYTEHRKEDLLEAAKEVLQEKENG